jgi:ribosomal protein L12E/L44/L45/RPP1/RPP2
MTPIYGFEITTEDVATVLTQMGAQKDPQTVSQLFERLDACQVEKAALHGQDIDEQTEYAYQEIQDQLNRFGIPGVRQV